VETNRQNASLALGQRIRQFRIAAKLTQSQVAVDLGVHYQSYQRYESGKTMIPSDRLAAIADILNLPLETLAQSSKKPSKGSSRARILREPLSPEEVDLLVSFRKITDRQAKASLIVIAKSLANDKS